MTPATIQEKGSGLLQVFLGLLAGGTITMALFALAFFYAPHTKESQAIHSPLSEVASPTPMLIVAATATPEATSAPTPSPTATDSTPQALTAPDVTSASAPSVFDQAGLLPPPPISETASPGTASPTENSEPVMVISPAVTPPAETIPTSEIPAASGETHAPTGPQSLPSMLTPTPASSFHQAALNSRKRAESAQDYADSLDAAQKAQSPYEQGLNHYTEGVESLEKERFRTAERHFVDAARAFILAATLSSRGRPSIPQPTQPYHLVEQARSLAGQRKYAQAEKVYQEYLVSNPQDAGVSLEYGEMLVERVSYNRGMKVLAQTLQIPGLPGEGRARIHARFADGYRRSGDLQTAIREIRMALQDDPQNPTYLSMHNQYQYEASERAKAQQQRQNFQQRVIGDLTGSLFDSLLH